MINCNCPVCLTGVVEPVGYIELKEGPLEFCFGRYPLTNKVAILIGLCSRGNCQYIGLETASESLVNAKSLIGSDLKIRK
ncbi:hypothetical protein FHS16_005986 [Paenibacillus endophyticus]|uniref:Uncharacterized protein n=1 Tax=Paenibacillus endophyticus TaxID=1294268 RepID=A0A7W5CDV8_9BACL|nr:hypothetical protein [Paenibacillus endophyticus]